MSDIAFRFLPRPVLPAGCDPMWWDRAACKEAPSDVFFPEKTVSNAAIGDAKAYCAVCPVRKECLIEAAFFNDDWRIFSVRGGLTAKDRRQLKRSLAKTGAYGDPANLNGLVRSA